MKISPPKNPLGKFLFFFTTQCISYFLIVANTRAYTSGLCGWTAATDGIFAAQNYVMLRLIAKDEASGFWSGAGYTAGGVVGSLLSIFVTKILFGR